MLHFVTFLRNKGNKFFTKDIKRHPEGTRAQALRCEPYPFNASVNSTKDLQTQNHVITRNNIKQIMPKYTQSDVVIPNKLDNGETCLGLRHSSLFSYLKNIFLKPVRNDMNIKNETNLEPY